MRRLAEELLARERSGADMRQTKNAVATKDMLTELSVQLFIRLGALRGKEEKSNKALTDFKSKLNVAEKQAKDVPSEKDGLQARLQQSQGEQNKVDGRITRVQGATDRFSAGLKEDWQHMGRRKVGLMERAT